MPHAFIQMFVFVLMWATAEFRENDPTQTEHLVQQAHRAYSEEDYHTAIRLYHQAIPLLNGQLQIEKQRGNQPLNDQQRADQPLNDQQRGNQPLYDQQRDEQAPDDVRTTLSVVYNNLADSYEMVGRSNIALDYYKKAYETWELDDTENINRIFTSLNNLVYILAEYGDIRMARHYTGELVRRVHEALEQHILSRENEVHARVLTFLNQIKVAALALDVAETTQLLTDLDGYIKTLSLAEKTAYNSYFLAMHESAGFMYVTLRQYDAAIRQYRRMTEFPLDPFFDMKFHANTAVAHNYAGNFETSLVHTNESMKYFEQHSFGVSLMSLQTLKALNLHGLGQSDEALELVGLIFSEILERSVSLPDLASLTYADFDGRNNSRFLSILLRCADLVRDASGDTDTALNLYRLTTDMFYAYYRKEAYNPALEELHKRTETGLLELVLGRPESDQMDAINRLENNNSQQFWRSFILKNERYLQDQDLQFSESGPVDVLAVQKQLHPEEVLIRYYLSETALFAVTVSRESFRVHRLAEGQWVANAATELHAHIIRRDNQYRSLADTLYQRLIAPLGLPEGARLVIIPDGVMSYIPFEVLSEGGSLLLQKHPIRYSFSMRFAGFSYPEVSHERFLATYAPDYSGTSYAAIRHSMTEAQDIARRLDGVVYAQHHATKSSFLGNLGRYAIHHLAMHAVQDPFNFENSALIFAGGERLPFYELHTAFIPAEMVVLSACETGIGALEPGVGLMGLSRALAYAGVRSSVHSLWEVPDRETSMLMVYFYEQLRQGVARDEALRRAKLHFLSENPLQAHPFYWAGFVLNGSFEPLVSPRGTGWWVYIPVFLLLLAGAVWFRRRRSGSKT